MRFINRIAGLFNLKINAESKQNIVVAANIGMVPKVKPNATVNDNFSGVMPCFKNGSNGSKKDCLKNPDILFFIKIF